jgi:hypothetical protein
MKASAALLALSALIVASARADPTPRQTTNDAAENGFIQAELKRGLAARDNATARSVPSYIYVGSSDTRNGYCYDSASQVLSATSCTRTSQIRTDAFRTGACSGATCGTYIYYCPAWWPKGGLSSEQGKCAAGVLVQALATDSARNGFALSDATCATCGDARYCPVSRDKYSKLNPRLYRCVGGGDTDANGVTWCDNQPTGGFIALLVIVPLLGLAGGVAGCCFCCPGCPGYKRTHRPPAPAAQQMMFMVPMMMMPMHEEPTMMAEEALLRWAR